jgi:hypothetical protein
MFAVILIDQDYDYIEGLECVKCFNTEQEANDFIVSENQKHQDSHTELCKYIDKFIDENVDIPDLLEYSQWNVYRNKFELRDAAFVYPGNLKEVLKGRLKWGHDVPAVIKDKFNPPPIYACGNLRVVEIPIGAK